MNTDPAPRLDELIEELDGLPEAARQLAQECLQSVLALHAEGLARLLQLVENLGEAGRPILESMQRDDLVRTLLLVHGLHPQSLETRLHEALEKVRPYMNSHGGNVELVSLEGDVARLRFRGACHSCPSSAVTLELAIRRALEEACPDLMGLELEGALPPQPNVEPVPHTSIGTWTELPRPVKDDGGITRIELDDVPLVICRLGQNLYAYRDLCPACGLTLDGSGLHDDQIQCRLGHRYDVRRAGRSPDNPALHLDPFPLLVEEQTVKVALK